LGGEGFVVKCLVVEDDRDLSALICGALRASGHTVVGCGDLIQAWSLLETSLPDIVVIDLSAPGDEGMLLCRRLRGLPDGERPAIVALTGAAEDVAAVLDAGANDVVVKPFDLELLELRLAIAERQVAVNAARAAAQTERETLLQQAEAARQRAAFLDEVSHLLSESLEYEATLRTVAQLAVPLIADYCIVDVVEPDRETPRQVAVVHVDPAQAEVLREMRRRHPPDPNGPNPGSRAMRGEQVLVSQTPPTLVDELAQDDEQARQLASLRVRSYMGMPIVARERILGAITLVATADSGRRYGPDDLALAQELARRAATAVDNALLYRQAQRTSQRMRALAWAATEAQTAADEDEIFAVIDAAIVRSGLNVHASMLTPARADEPGRLVVRHVGLTDPALLPAIERLLGRPIVGIRMNPQAVSAFRSALEHGRPVLVPDAAEWLRDALPWISPRAAQVIGRLRQVGQGVCVPVTDGHEVLGALSIWGESLDEADLPPMELLGRQAGGAVAGLRLRLADRERNRLDGALLLARTAAHAINNALGLTTGYAELLAAHPSVASNAVLWQYVQEVLTGAQLAAERLERFQHVIRLEETPSPLGADRPVLDLDRSTAPES
jgi:DNA-binding response OmpR family regulator